MDKVQEKLSSFPDTQQLKQWAEFEGELNDPRISDRLTGFDEYIMPPVQPLQGKIYKF